MFFVFDHEGPWLCIPDEETIQKLAEENDNCIYFRAELTTDIDFQWIKSLTSFPIVDTSEYQTGCKERLSLAGWHPLEDPVPPY